MSNFTWPTNYVVFGLFLILATLVALLLILGADILAWHFLRPQGYWQGLALIIVEAFTILPRGFFAVMSWLLISKFGAEVS